jgi:CubicO group peptidase (beta-lactamase class C family)
MSLEKFLISIPNPDHKGSEEMRGTIQQFTPQGLEAATSYYNQKYPERGQIHQAMVIIEQVEREAVVAETETQAGLVEKMVDGVLENLIALKSKVHQEGSQKLLFTIAEEDEGKIRIAHSIPFVLADGKLILLRDENNEFGQQIFSKIAEKLGVELVQSREPIYDKQNPARTSIQGDHSSCHFIALGVLKDLTAQDLQKVSAFENSFMPLPKSLKYSQSATHIQKSLPEEEFTTEVKKDGRSLVEYAAQNKREEKSGGEKITITRITEKFNRFKSDLEKIVGATEGDLSAPDLAAQILQRRQLQTKEAILELKDPFHTTASLVMPSSEYATRGKLKSGEVVVKSITLDGVDGVPICSSVALIEGGKTQLKIGEEALFSADSMTKTITSAALLRMTEEKKYQKFFLKEDPVETKLWLLMPLLKERFPNSNYIQTELEKHPDFKKITLRNLAQHTSGLTETAREALNEKLVEGKKLSVEEILDTKKSEKTGQHGEYFYSNLGYELLGAALVAIHSKANEKVVGVNSKYSEVVNELVIDRVKEKMGSETETAKSLQFFTSDQMEESLSGKTQVVEHSELEIKFGKAFRDGKFSETASHRYDIACGGSYTTPESMAHIALHVLNGDVFKETKTLEIFNSSKIKQTERDSAGNLKEKGWFYGFGYESPLDPNLQQYRFHSGLGYGSNSTAAVNIETNKAAVAMVSFEQNLTLPLAYALIHNKKSEGEISLTPKPSEKPKLFEKSLELQKTFSENQLVKMRQELEKSYEEFKREFKALQKQRGATPMSHKQRIDALDLATKPLSSPKQSYAEKLVEKGILVSKEI